MPPRTPAQVHRHDAATQTLLALVVLLLASALAAAERVERNGFDLTGSLVPPEEIHAGGPPKDGIPAIDRPVFVRADRAGFLKPGERVLGVARHGMAKAYPVAILNWHEVVNDRFESEPVAVTFCPLCGTGMAFIAASDGSALRFGVSGLLYNSDVLLYDRRTQSLWSQLLSMAISGPMKGRRLVFIATSHTTWADWRERHPDTLVLSPDTGHARDYARDPYAGYARSEELMFPVRFASRRFHPKERVIGVALGGRAKAYAFSDLSRSPMPVSDTIGERRVQVEFDRIHGTGRILDATGGELPSVVAYWFAWYAFHPDTEIFSTP
jgi:hypothetical protein